MRTITETIPEEYDGKKLYSYIKGKMKMSAKLIRTLKTYPEGLTVNGKHTRTVDIVHKGDVLCVNIKEERRMSKLGSTLPDVVYEDEDILVVNKPPFLAIHESHNHRGDTLANEVALHLSNEGKRSTFRAVGRLDKGTSGLVVCALNSHAASKLNAKIEKEYTAIALGEYTECGTIDAPIFRPDPIITKRIVDSRGSFAITHYEPIKTNGELSLLKVKIETGRTHRIRVHFSYLGTPLYGDWLYGTETDDIDHHCLHCGKIRFIHPVTDKEIIIEAPMPDDMQKIADRI